MSKYSIVSLLFLFSLSANALAEDPSESFVRKASTESGFSESEVRHFLNAASYKPWIIETMDKPGEAVPWYKYKRAVITDAKVANGKKFIQENIEALEAAEAKYSVPKEVIAAIIGIESGYGANKGRVKVIDSLSTLSFHYPRREKFFQAELIEFLAMSKREGLNPLEIEGSYAGAIGWPQFMPSSIKKLAIDFDEDGHIDIVNSPVDAIGSVANYLNKSGWVKGAEVVEQMDGVGAGTFQLDIDEDAHSYYKPFGNFKAILKYNRSNLYAMAVFELSQKIKIDG